MFRRKNRNILVNILWGWVVRFPTASGLGNLTRGWVTLKCTFALTSVDLSTPRSRRNVRGQVWLQTSLWPIWLKSTSARNIHEYISDIKAQFLPALDICRIVLCLWLTRIVTSFQRRRHPGTWLLILLTSRLTWWWASWWWWWTSWPTIGSPTMAGTSWARLLERARLKPISALPLCCSNGTKALVLP